MAVVDDMYGNHRYREAESGCLPDLGWRLGVIGLGGADLRLGKPREVGMSSVDQMMLRNLRLLARDTRQRVLGGVGLGIPRAPELARSLKLPISTVRSNLYRLEEAGLVVAHRTRGFANYSLGQFVQVRPLDKAKRFELQVRTPSGGEILLTRSMAPLPKRPPSERGKR